MPATLPYTDNFSTNSYTLVNGTQTNKWAYGTATGNTGSSIYISIDNGTTNTYTNTSTSAVHSYRDISIPSGSATASFSFDWKGVGESCCDFLRVWMVPTSFVPTAGTQITSGSGRIQIGGNLNNQSSWQTYSNTSLNISSFAGSSMRLVFEWYNDGSSGSNPAMAIDNVSLSIPSCLTPSITATTSIAATTATINWSAPSPAPSNGYQWEVRTSGAGGSGATGLAASGTVGAGVLTASATGLTANTAYTVYVRSDCGGSGFSTWASGGAFTTQVLVATPYLEPFTTISTPSGWNITGWTIGSARGVTGNTGNNIYSNLWSSATTATFTTVNVGPISSGQLLTFDWKSANYNSPYGAPGSGTGNIVVSISTDWGASYTAINTTSTGANNTWNSYSYDLSSYGGQNVKVRIVGNWVSGDYDLAFDNIKIETPPAPTITTVTSSQTCADTTKVVIDGTNLMGISAASINGVSLFPLDSNTNTRAVKFMTTAFVSGGNVSVTTGGGTATQANSLAFTIAPALALDSPNFTICKGSTSTNVSLTSTSTNYTSYTLTPSSGVGGSGAGPWTFAPSATTTYTLNASHSGTQCIKSLKRTITMADTPSRLTLSQGSNRPHCNQAIDSLMVSGGTSASSYSSTENFTGASLPPSWIFVNGINTTLWVINTGTSSGGAANELRLDANSAGISDNSTWTASLPVIDASNFTSGFQLSFKTFLDVFSATTYPSTIRIQTSTNNSTWSDAWTYTPAGSTDYGPATVIVSLTPLQASPTVYIRFNFTGRSFGIYTWNIDDVSITANSLVQNNISWTPNGAGSGLFTDRAATAAYTSGHAAKLYTKPSTTTKYYAQAQTGTCIVRDSIIDSAKAAADLVTLASASVTGAVAQCTDGGWTYYSAAADPDKLIFAINKNGNTFANTVDVTVSSGAVDSSKSSNGGNQEHGSFMMKRYWNVDCGGCTPTTNGGVSVRFFYDPSDTAVARTAMRNSFTALKASNPSTLADTTLAMQWVKTVGVPYTTSVFTGNRLTAPHIKQTPIYGTQGSLSYVQFDTIKSFSGGGGGFGFGPSGGGGGGVGLPVTWAGFDVVTAEQGNVLTWKTASEQNTDYFEVQYSYDAQKWFIGSDPIPAAGNSADMRTYHYTHADFAPFVYYRIKQVDLDGKFENSVVKTAKRAAGPSFVVKVYPIPMLEDNLVHVSAKGIDKSEMHITMTDISGKVIRTVSYIPSSESILESFDMSPLTPGLYFIEVQNGQGKEMFKVSR